MCVSWVLPCGGIVWEGLECVALLEELCYLGQILRFQMIYDIPRVPLSQYYLLRDYQLDRLPDRQTGGEGAVPG